MSLTLDQGFALGWHGTAQLFVRCSVGNEHPEYGLNWINRLEWSASKRSPVVQVAHVKCNRQQVGIFICPRRDSGKPSSRPFRSIPEHESLQCSRPCSHKPFTPAALRSQVTLGKDGCGVVVAQHSRCIIFHHHLHATRHKLLCLPSNRWINQAKLVFCAASNRINATALTSCGQ